MARRKHPTRLGKAVIGVSCLILCWLGIATGVKPFRVPLKVVGEKAPPKTAVVLAKGDASAGWLSIGGSFDANALLSGGSDTALLIDGALGFSQEAREWIEREFGKISPFEGRVLVCFEPSAAMPIVQSSCPERSAIFRVEPHKSVHSYARARSGEVVGVAKKFGTKWVYLRLYDAPFEASAEEVCLDAVASGGACASLQSLPALTVRAVSFATHDLNQQAIIGEFGVPMNPSVPERAALVPCVADQVVLRAKMGRLMMESDVDALLRDLKYLPTCAKHVVIDLPRDPTHWKTASLRSLLVRMRERPYWLTDSMSPAFRDLRRAEAGLVLTAEGDLEVIPAGVSDALSVMLWGAGPLEWKLSGESLAGPVHEWHLMRLRPRVLVLTLDGVMDRTTVSLQSLRMGRGGWSGIISPHPRWSLALLVGLVIAQAITIFQGLAGWRFHNRTVISGPTFFAVFVLTVAWSLGAYEHGQVWSTEPPSKIFEEGARLRRYTFLRDWPTSWWPQEERLMPAAIKSPASDPWYASAEQLVKNAAPPKQAATRVLSRLDVKTMTSLKKPATVYLLETQAARNFYYRRSPQYGLELAQWERFLKRDGIKVERLTELSPVVFAPLANEFDPVREPVHVLVIPDAFFLNERELGILDEWVSSGGRVIFSERLSGETPPGETLNLSHPFTEVMMAAGLGKSERASYATLSYDGVTKDLKEPLRRLQGTGEWVRTVPRGRGAIHFLGFSPGESVAEEAIRFVLQRLGGSAVRMPPVTGGKCLATVLIEPYGVGEPLVRDFMARADKARLAFSWLSDPKSFAGMYPTWKAEFQKRGLVFLTEDGTMRGLAAALAQKAGGRLSPSIVTHRYADAKPLGGPDVASLSFQATDRSEDLVATIVRSCRAGFADVTLLSVPHVTAHPERWLDALKTAGQVVTFVPADAYVKALEASLSARESSGWPVFYADRDPFVLRQAEKTHGVE